MYVTMNQSNGHDACTEDQSYGTVHVTYVQSQVSMSCMKDQLYGSTKNAAERHLMHHIWISISKVTAFQTLHFE